MKTIKNYYATALCYTTSGAPSSTLPAFNRYFLFIGFDEETIKLVNELNLQGEWTLMCGKKEQLDFSRESVSNGKELSDITPYIGQVYKRTPSRKTFVIKQEEFITRLLELSCEEGQNDGLSFMQNKVSHLIQAKG
jgi:hypothetical protein